MEKMLACLHPPAAEVRVHGHCRHARAALAVGRKATYIAGAVRVHTEPQPAVIYLLSRAVIENRFPLFRGML